MPILGAKGAASVGGFGFNGGFGPCLIVATGGDSVVDSGDFRTHIFTGTGNFAVKDVKAASSGKVDYMVIAGGGSTGGEQAQEDLEYLITQHLVSHHLLCPLL
jgi:hypothetical protein